MTVDEADGQRTRRTGSLGHADTDGYERFPTWMVLVAALHALFIYVLPDMLVGVLPVVAGIGLSIASFSRSRLSALIALILLHFGGTAMIRGSIACKYCMQRDLGCPAHKLFGGTPRSGAH